MNINKLFRRVYRHSPDACFECGGRFEILGNHTDHNHGLCLTSTANLAINAAVSKRKDNVVRLYSVGFRKIKIDLNDLEYYEEEKSGAMIRGIAKYFKDHNLAYGGFDCACSSDIFVGAGLSSSAAFELIIGEIFNELFNDGQIDKLTLCKAGQYSENYYYCKKSGLLDQIGVAYGGLVSIDFKDIDNPKIEQLEFPFKDLHFVTVNTGGDHSLLNDLYSSIPEDMWNAAKKMNKRFLSECLEEDMMNVKNFTEMEKSRAEHFFGENERVINAIEAIKNNDEQAFLDAVNGSRISSTINLKNMMIDANYEGSPLEATDTAMKLMKNEGACKINGGGFAGSIICLVPNKFMKFFMKKMKKIYGRKNIVEIFVKPTGVRKIV